MKGLSVLFTIFLFVVAAKLSRQLKLAGALPEQAHDHNESTVVQMFASTTTVQSTFAKYPLVPQRRYD